VHIFPVLAMAEIGVVLGAAASRNCVTSPMTMLLLLLLQSHLELGVVVAAVRHQRRYNYNNYYNNDNDDNDVASRWTTVASTATSSSFVFRDCGKPRSCCHGIRRNNSRITTLAIHDTVHVGS